MKPRSQQLTGVLTNSGSLYLTGSLNASQGFTGSLQGSASYAITASYSINAVSSSYAATSSYSKDLQISGSINNVDYINFNTSSVVIQPVPGKISWNDIDGTLDIGLKGGNVTLQVGQEEVLRIVNKTGANLLEADYRVVRVRSVAEGGAQGQRLAVVLAQGNNDPNSATTLGIVTENINLNEEGFITTSGKVRGINTTGTLQGETWVDGDMLFLSPTTPGRLTNIKPQAPNHTVIMGYVVYAHNSQGIIFVKVDNGYEIDELHNVLINTGSLNTGELLVRSGSVWINSKQLTGSYGLTGSLNATSFVGSLTGTASYALTASYSTNVFGQSYYIPTFTGVNTLATSSIYQSGSFTSIRNATTPLDPSNPDILYVNGNGVDTYNLISAHGDLDNYLQLNIQNFSPNSTASSDIVATADIGTEIDHYIDMGINGSGYNDPNGIGSALDAYLYSTGQDLLIGNATDGNRVIIFNGDGPALDNARVYIDSIGTVGINAITPTIGNPEALLVEAINNTTYNLIKAKGNVDNFLQTAIVNSNTGSKASADIVAYNNLDPNSSAFGFIDMGINSSNFNDPINYPGWNPGDSYLYTDAPRLTIGSSNNTGSINFYVGDLNPTSGSKFQLRASNSHSLSGSLNVSGSITAFSFTGSLRGTSSNAISSSFATTASYILNAVSSSFASTASHAPLYLPLTGGTINGDVVLNGTASIAYLNVTIESASVIYSSGSNQFGDATNDTQTLIGRVITSGSLQVTGSVDVTSGSLIIRSSSFNGIGLGSTLPSANLHINNPNNSQTFLRIDRADGILFDFAKGSTSQSHKFRTYTESGSVLGSIGIVNSGDYLSYNIAGDMSGTKLTDIAAGTVFSSTGTSAFGNPSFLFYNYSTANYATYAGSIKPALIRLQGTHGASSGTGEYAAIRIANTINQTGGTGINFGIIYEPILTSIAGAHYGLVIRPSSTLNGIGHTTNLPTATWHVKGDSDSVGNVLAIENLSNTSYLTFSNGGVLTTNQPSGGSNYTTFDFLRGGSKWLSLGSSAAAGQGLFFGNQVASVTLNSSTLTLRAATSATDIQAAIDFVNTNTTAPGSPQFRFRNEGTLAYSFGGNPVTVRSFQLLHNLSVSTGNASQFITTLHISPTYNQTAGGVGLIGIDYDPTITSITGAHYGLLLRSSTLNGIGLGLTLPSSSLHIRGGSTGSVLLLESNISSSIFTINNNGSGSFVGFLTATGSLIGTASWAENAVTASYVLNAVSSSFAATASYFSGSITNAVSASYALTASYALNGGGGGVAFPYTGSAVITGSLIVTGSVSLGDPTAPAVYTSIKTTVNSGSTIIYNMPTASYDGAFFDYVLKSGTGARAGNIMAVWSGSGVSYTDNSTSDLGNTSGFTFAVVLSGSNMVLTSAVATNGWTLKTAVRTI